VSPIFEGRFVEATTHAGLPDIAVSVFGYPDTVALSDGEGYFRVGPAYGKYWGYILTPAFIMDFPTRSGDYWDKEHRICLDDMRFGIVDQLPDRATVYAQHARPNFLFDLGNVRIERKDVQHGCTEPRKCAAVSNRAPRTQAR